MKNCEIRESLRMHSMKQWELADLLGLSEQTVCRWLRKELPEDKKILILEVIERSE